MSPSQSSIAVVLLRVGGVACQAIMFALLANVLDTPAMGIFSSVYVFWGLVRMLGPAGLDQIAMREISYARARHDNPLSAAIGAHAIKAVVAVTAVLGVATAVAVGMLAGRGVASISPANALVIALAVPAFGLVGLLTAMVRAYDRNIASQAIETIGIQILATVLLGAQWFSGTVTLGSALLIQAVGAWLTVAVCSAALRGLVSLRCKPLAAELKHRMRSECLELWQALIMIGLAARAPTFISLSLLGPAATAVLEIAMRFGTLPTIFTAAVSTTYGPALAREHARNDKLALGESLATASWLAFLPSAATMIMTIALGPWLLAQFFPPAYSQAYIPLLLIVAATTVNGTFGMSSTLLMMTGHQRIVRLYSLLQLGSVVLVSCAGGLLFGIYGVAAAVLVGFVVFDVGLALRIKPLLGIVGILRPSGIAALGRGLKFGSWRIPAESAE